MSFESLLIHDVLLVNPVVNSSVDRYGNEIVAFDAGVASPGRMQPNSSDEDIVDRDTRVSTYTLFLPMTATISAFTRVIWDTKEFRVSGEPKVESDGVGPHHVEATCVLVEG